MNQEKVTVHVLYKYIDFLKGPNINYIQVFKFCGIIIKVKQLMSKFHINK